MRTHRQPSRYASRPRQGVALVLVMLVMMAMMVIAGIFAYSIKIETKLAYNTQSETEMEWLGRSGVEVARWVLFTEKRIPQQAQYDALHQFWAGGPGPLQDLPDYPFAGMSLKNIPCGPHGHLSIEIVDEDRKININAVPPQLLEKLFTLAGAEVGDSQLISGSIQDWRDRDDNLHPGGGAESDYYRTLDPPYLAKNGPIDDIRELLKIRGITPELFWGGPPPGSPPPPPGTPRPAVPPIGLIRLFCANSQGRVNVNTASAEVLAILLGINDVTRVRETIIRRRAGEDGVDGTLDDMPFRNPQEAVAALAGGGSGNPGSQQGVTSLLSAVSTTFEVRVEATLGSTRRRYVALVRRATGPEPVVMYFRRD